MLWGGCCCGARHNTKNAIFQKPLHYQHKNLWSGKSVENLIKLYVIFLSCTCYFFPLMLFVVAVVSYFCQWLVFFYLVEKFSSLVFFCSLLTMLMMVMAVATSWFVRIGRFSRDNSR